MAAEARGFAFNMNHNLFRVLDAWNASDQAIAKISTELGQANQFPPVVGNDNFVIHISFIWIRGGDVLKIQ